MGVRVGIVTFPGSLDDRDAARAVRLVGATPVPLWHGTHDLDGVDALILPGGFSYGDYLRAGAIASLSPIMAEVVAAADSGMPVLGICNGFQMLTEARLLPGGLIRNDHGNFICRDQRLRVENTSTAWTSAFAGGGAAAAGAAAAGAAAATAAAGAGAAGAEGTAPEITIPLKNGEGGYIASADTLERLEGEGHVVFRYLDVNPNGSMNDIAGITNARGNVVGLMPHPEHAVEPGFGPDTPSAMRSGTDGLPLFASALTALLPA